MKLQFPFIQLPLAFDAGALAAEIAALGEDCWRPHPQGFPGNSMLPLVAVDGDPANEGFAGPMAPTPALLACPYLIEVFASLGATVGRSRLMRLAGQSEVTLHADQGYYWTERVRVHVPVVTQPTVRFECGGTAVNMAAGECWIFDTWRLHRVFNDALESRIHLVVDTVGGGPFWDMVARGRRHDAAPDATAWHPRQVAPGTGAGVPAFESVNVPRVMSPWELSDHLGFLFAEAVPHPGLASLQQHAGRLMRQWRALWAEHGDSEAGAMQFRALFDGFAAAVRGPAQGVMLRNEMRWHDVLLVMVGRAAAPAAPSPDTLGVASRHALGDNA